MAMRLLSLLNFISPEMTKRAVKLAVREQRKTSRGARFGAKIKTRRNWDSYRARTRYHTPTHTYSIQKCHPKYPSPVTRSLVGCYCHFDCMFSLLGLNIRRPLSTLSSPARDSSGSSSGIYGSLYPSAKAVRDFEYRPRNDLGARTPQPPNNYEIKIKFQTEPTTPLDSYSSFADSTDESAPPQRRFRRLFQKSHNTESSSPPDSEPKFDPMPKPKIKSEHKPRKPDFEPEPYDAEPRLDDIDEVEYKKPERRYDDPVVKVKREVKEVISISSKDQPPVVATVQKSKAVIQENKMFRRQDQRIGAKINASSTLDINIHSTNDHSYLPERDQDPPSNLHRPNSPDWKKPQTLEGIRAYRDPYTSLQPAPPPPQYYKPTREPQYITPTPQALGSIPPSFASNSSGRMNTELAELLQTLPSEVDDVDLTVEIPEQLTVTLMKHQLHGLAWMLDREDKAMGGILADLILGLFTLARFGRLTALLSQDLTTISSRL
ncbi:hypothetical protein BC937DRAFT_93799 [Endogone sp. FLAS-F59071]|nr:hypothetical protein BC937DRAFT_93799 [Endogone sp. FLAS-F59071]|eukprot:RUS21033.1 hypothetical protein BC937DRAFT_93799 [Endogone sp. FLAS-F59071]